MSETVIKVENISKLYGLGEFHRQTHSFREKVTETFTRLAPSCKRQAVPNSFKPARHALTTMRSSQTDDRIWALKDVSFEVRQGEVLGIIGANGAGKSTILKILARITKPTEGRARINGQVGALLEVGMGFHPELTGRENIYLNGTILGMKKTEIDSKFDDIVIFSEIGEFIDTPIKRYSSGMHVRLAFAVAAHLEPDILLVDEVLAVGDIAFQEKCLRKMQGFGQKGITVIFVSHNLVAMQTLCPKTMVLDHGRIQFFGRTEAAVVYYQRYMAQHLMGVISKGQQENVHEKRKVGILQIDLLNESREPTTRFVTGEVAYIVLTVEVYETLDSLRFAVLIKKGDGSVIFDTDSRQLGVVCQKRSAGDRLKVEFKLKMNLLKGVYSISAHVRPHDLSSYYYYTETVCSFEVSENYSWQGVAHLEPRVRILGEDS
jgi:lipopolysaccharide transport system ATP-binding protein